MKTPIYRILLVVGAFFSFSCGDERSTDKADTQPSVAAKPELVIGELDTLKRLLSITILTQQSNPLLASCRNPNENINHHLLSMLTPNQRLGVTKHSAINE